jgi:predicted dithiol-disulfide oxidoreductase (DUF899 family)
MASTVSPALADNITGALVHVAARDTAFAVVSRASLAAIEPFRRRMGWEFRWASSYGRDFNYDFGVTLDNTRGGHTYNFTDARVLKDEGRLWMDELPA